MFQWGIGRAESGVGGRRRREEKADVDPQCCWLRSVCCSREGGRTRGLGRSLPSRHYSASSPGLWSCVVMAELRRDSVAATWACRHATADSQLRTLISVTPPPPPPPSSPLRTPTRPWVHSSWTPGRTGSLQTQSSLLVTNTARAVTSTTVNITTKCRPLTNMDTQGCPATHPETPWGTPWDTPTTTSNAVPCRNSRYWPTSTTKL